MSISDTQSIGGLVSMTQDRLEELRLTSGSSNFWDADNELAQLVCEALNEAALISGEPEIVTIASGIAANSIQQQVPQGIAAMLRVELGGTPVLKTTLYHMDKFLPGWQNTLPLAEWGPDPFGNGPFWFPMGVTSFGIYPTITSGTAVSIFGVAATAHANPGSGTFGPLARSAYNANQLVSDPGFLAGATQWTAGSVINTVSPNGLTLPCLEVTLAGGAGVFSKALNLVSGNTYSYSGWFKNQGTGTWFLYYTQGALGEISSLPRTTAWYNLFSPVVAPGPANSNVGYWGIVNTGASDTATIWAPSVVSDYVPFQQEYGEAFSDLAASRARIKDGSIDMQQGKQQMQDFLSKMTLLARFGLRKSALRFTTGLGTASKTTEIEKRY